MKPGFQIIMKSIQIPLPQEIQISDPLLMGTYFFPNNKMWQGACWPNSNKFQGPENFQ
jgi:hypothetical protein